jgi:hypothetical protein
LKKKEFRIFYSWQSDSPTATNSGAIRTALRTAAKELAKVAGDIEIVVDEATRGTSGSPNIAAKIFEKIDQASMFVCDITTINPRARGRRCPNPNVAYELGYAMAILGEDRVVMLFNKAHGRVPLDLPFDFVQNRVSTYLMKEPVSAEEKKSLVALVKASIKAIIDKDPKTAQQLRGLSKEKIEHTHDVDNMRWLMSKINITMLEEHISDLPQYISAKAFWFWEDFNAIVRSQRFSLYDKTLDGAVRRLHRAWTVALNYCQYYHEAQGGRLHVFTNPGDGPLPPNKQKAWDRIDEAKGDMANAFVELLNRLRTEYIEVPISQLSDDAWKAYVKDMQEERQLSERLFGHENARGRNVG